GSQTGTASARSRFSHWAEPLGQVPSTGRAETGSWSPSPAIRRDETSRTNSGAPAGTGGRMATVLVAAPGTGTSASAATDWSTAVKFFSTTISPRLPYA